MLILTHIGNINKRICFIIFLFTISISCFCQELYLKGKITGGGNNEALVSANILVTRKSDSTRFGAYSDAGGFFKITKLPPSVYKIKISIVGYKPFEKNIELKQNTDIGIISLKQDSIVLSGVTATGKAILMELKDDTVQYNAKAVKLHEDAVVEDLIRKLPGIKIDSKGELKTKGEKISKIYVDKKPFFGNDTKAALQNLPADMVEKVQVYDETSEQSKFTGFSDGETIKVINLETKMERKFNSGKFGKISTGLGWDKEYQTAGNYNYFDTTDRISVVGLSNNMNISSFAADNDRAAQMSNTQRNSDGLVNGFGINYSSQLSSKYSLSGNYSFTTSDVETETGVNRYYNQSTGLNQKYYETRNMNRDNNNHNGSFNFSYRFDEKTNLMFSPNFFYMSNKSSSDSRTKILFNDTLSNDMSIASRSKMNSISCSGFLLFNRVLSDSGRRLSVQFNGGYNGNDGSDNWENRNIIASGINGSYSANSSTSDNRGKKISANLLYTEPINRSNLLQLSYHVSFIYDKSDKQSYGLTEETSILDSASSSLFQNKSWNHKTGVSYNYRTNEMDLSLGLFYNLGTYNKNQDFPFSNYTNHTFRSILSSLSLSYRIDKKSIRLRYNSQPYIPSIDRLQNVLNNKNVLQMSIGNPSLKEAMGHSLSISIPQNIIPILKDFDIKFNGSITKDYVGSHTILASRDTVVSGNIMLQKGAQLTYPENFDRALSGKIGIFYFPILDSIDFSINPELNLSYSNVPLRYNGIKKYSSISSVGLGLHILPWNSSDKINCEIDFEYKYNISKSQNQNTTHYNDYNTRFNLRYRFPYNFSIIAFANHQYNTGIQGGNSSDNLIINLSLSWKFLKGSPAEIMFSVYDLLNKNKDISKSITDLYIEERKTNLPKRCYFLTFSYNFRQF